MMMAHTVDYKLHVIGRISIHGSHLPNKSPTVSFSATFLHVNPAAVVGTIWFYLTTSQLVAL